MGWNATERDWDDPDDGRIEIEGVVPRPICPGCGSLDCRKATVFWQCFTCGYEWKEA